MLCVCMPGMAAETDRKDELFRFRPPPSSESRPIIIFLLSLLSGGDRAEWTGDDDDDDAGDGVGRWLVDYTLENAKILQFSM